jgi:hypothetical protein
MTVPTWRFRDWRRIGGYFLAALGALWTAIEVLDFFVGAPQLRRTPGLVVVPLVAGALGLALGRSTSRVCFGVPGTSSSITIRYGDVLSGDGCVAIPCNELFDHDVGRIISPLAVQGQLVVKLFGHDRIAARDAFDRALADEHGAEKIVRSDGGREVRYRIGTVGKLDHGPVTYLLVAFAHTDPQTSEASADINDLLRALDGLWRAARSSSNGRRLVMPLMGGGLSKLGLPTNHLLSLIISAFVVESRRRLIVSEFEIVIWPGSANVIDLRTVEQLWRGS